MRITGDNVDAVATSPWGCAVNPLSNSMINRRNPIVIAADAIPAKAAHTQKRNVEMVREGIFGDNFIREKYDPEF